MLDLTKNEKWLPDVGTTTAVILVEAGLFGWVVISVISTIAGG